MDRELHELELRRAADPADPLLALDLAGKYVQAGRPAEAYELLVEHPAIPWEHPRLRDIGAVLARRQAPILDGIAAEQGLGGTRFFAARRAPTGHWDWRPRWELKRRPARAINLAGTAWSRARLAAATGLETVVSLNLRNALVRDDDLRALASMTALRELDLFWCRELTVEGLEALAGLPRLERVVLWSREVHEQARRAFPSLSDLLV